MGGIIPAQGASGQTVYAQLRDLSSGQIANGSAFEAYNQAHWANYVIALSEQAGSGFYSAGVPGYVPAGRYLVTAYIQLGGSPAVNDTPFFTQVIDWDGGNSMSLASALNVGKINGNALAAANLAAAAASSVVGAAASGTLTTAQMTTNLAGAVANMYAGRVLIFTSGVNAGFAVLITAYAVTGAKLTFVAYNNQVLPAPPSAADTFVIL